MMRFSTEKYSTPVLLMTFNRPEKTKNVLLQIREAKPAKLYISSDGPRVDVPSDAALVRRVRELIQLIDWDCDVKTLFRDSNRGGPLACSEAISWFFSQESEGIILEDDTLPNPSFFEFCSQLLHRYRNDPSIWVISGNSFTSGRAWGDGSYYLTKYPLLWGWATWRRAWSRFDLELEFCPTMRVSRNWKLLHQNYAERLYWSRIFNHAYRKESVHWDYSWMATIWFYGGLSITPNFNLVSNIGFGEGASNCLDADSELSNCPSYEFSSLDHPRALRLINAADRATFEERFLGFSLYNWRSFFYLSKYFLREYMKDLKRRFRAST